MTAPAILALADGTIFYGDSIGISGLSVGEVVFNTSMTGYQEILMLALGGRKGAGCTYVRV